MVLDDGRGPSRWKVNTLEGQLELKAKIRRTVEINPDIPMYVIAQRFRMTVAKLREYLSDVIPYPSSYKLTANLIPQTLEQVAENRDAGRAWCKYCVEWFDEDKFYLSGNLTLKHFADKCERSARKRKGKK